jgi:hypothetical protein
MGRFDGARESSRGGLSVKFSKAGNVRSWSVRVVIVYIGVSRGLDRHEQVITELLRVPRNSKRSMDSAHSMSHARNSISA